MKTTITFEIDVDEQDKGFCGNCVYLSKSESWATCNLFEYVDGLSENNKMKRRPACVYLEKLTKERKKQNEKR